MLTSRPMAVSVRLLLVFLASCVEAGAAPAGLQEIIDGSSGSVAHLSIRDAKGTEEWSGSGFVVSESGRLATNFHVAEDAERIVAVFGDGREVEVVGAWSFHADDDVAVLQLAPGAYRPLPLAKSPPKQGDEVIVIGSPLGLGHSVSTGIVAAVRPHGTVRRDREDGFESWGLQITASIAPGSSGSPILNARGEVIGVAVGQMGYGALHFGVPVARLEALLANEAAVLAPLRRVRAGRSVRTNLLISAGVFAVIALVWGLTAWWSRRPRGTRRARPS